MLTATQKESLEKSIEMLLQKGVWYDDIMAVVNRALLKKGWVIWSGVPQRFGMYGLRDVEAKREHLRFDTMAELLKYCFENIFEVDKPIENKD